MFRIMKGIAVGIIAVGVTVTSACRDLTQDIPNGMVDPATFRTPEGAVRLYNGAKIKLMGTGLALEAGVFTDELHSSTVIDVSDLFGRVPEFTDARNVTQPSSQSQINNVYNRLHDARNHIDQAIGTLGLFPSDTSRRYQGELFALKGLVLTYFAETFCSGIPLSRVDFDGDFTYMPGISRDSVLGVALASYDSALVYAADDSLVSQMVAAGRARSWLQRDSLKIAATYAVQVRPGFGYALPPVGLTARPVYRVSDREGINGLPYRSSGDPRTRVTAAQNAASGIGDTTWYLQKVGSATTPVPLMTYVESALIAAEGALVSGEGDWVEQLNALRTSGTFTISGDDTLWNAGTGGVLGLAPLEDPGSGLLPSGKTAFDVRLDLLMSERAYWLFLTGTRLGDLRRLVRHYRRDAESVYPTGMYGRNGLLFNVQYGTDVVFPVPQEEQQRNLRYQGCFDLEA